MNSNGWQPIPLGRVLKRNDHCVAIDPASEYKEVTIRLWGKGIMLRRLAPGSDIAAERRFSVCPKQFILSRIDARNGAMGLVPAELDGAVVSNDFPAYDINSEVAIPEYLGWLCKTHSFVEACRAASEGTTNRVRLQENKFLALQIPLPPLPEQRRIVAKIERLAAKIDEARVLTANLVAECDQMCRALIRDDPNLTPTPMHELVTWRKPDIEVEPMESYDFAGVYCFGKGLFRSGRKQGADFAYTRLSRICTNEFVYPKLMAWEGALAVVPPECAGLFVSPEFPVFKIDDTKVLPEVLDVYFRSPNVWPTLSGASTGTNVRRRRLNPQDFLKYQFPVPTRSRQFQLRNIRRKVDELKRLQADSAEKLDALLPAILDRAFKGQL
jgi:type I restriction enzyme S subunit